MLLINWYSERRVVEVCNRIIEEWKWESWSRKEVRLFIERSLTIGWYSAGRLETTIRLSQRNVKKQVNYL